ncbi:hemerythrin domain-containing protein [Aromatoleum aromaticum]|uniref:hemerythrin domain-containing protein n=1 Tax=Aromatoleum aromaticum TaxID=551760 RepID=UPI0014598D67|nr:hemerythrin domain-containing protein [Aromatoleum aromaticum]NMG53518.1 Rsd/AlgQ family anti-sigma factor [Aromatoleum aromaticum]
MFLFDWLFGAKKEVASTARIPGGTAPGAAAPRVAATAPGTQIRHDPQLITALEEDHQHLLGIFTAIVAARNAGNLSLAQTQLDRLRIGLMDHLLKENVRLYVYLEHFLKTDAVSHELMHGFRHEMDDIGRAVVDFLDRYRQIGTHPELAAQFGSDLDAIGEALAGRIRREEEILYPMYLPPN